MKALGIISLASRHKSIHVVVRQLVCRHSNQGRIKAIIYHLQISKKLCAGMRNNRGNAIIAEKAVREEENTARKREEAMLNV